MSVVREKIIQTKYRRIVTPIPNPASQPLIHELEELEPRSMAGFPPVVWERAEGVQVYDASGNMWLDFSSAVVLANAGHANKTVINHLQKQINTGLLHCYCNPSKIRLQAVKAINSITPDYLDKVFLLTTGSEAVECALKLIRIYGRSLSSDKIIILSYTNSFHGRTMASQRAGGFMDQQEWMGYKPEGFYHIPYPECGRCPWGKEAYEHCGGECFRNTLNLLKEKGIPEASVAGVITETFQGPTVAYMPLDYVKALRDWTREQRALLVFDEIQAGFGRSGKWFGFEHYGVEADLITMAKGMTSCLPMSAVAGRGEILDLPCHGEMSSTHTGNPLSCAAVIGNIEAIREGNMIENAAALGREAEALLMELKGKFNGLIGAVNGKGAAWGVYLLEPRTGKPDIRLAADVTERCLKKGLLMLSTGRGTLKIAPPLCMEADALLEGIHVIEESLWEALEERKAAGGRC